MDDHPGKKSALVSKSAIQQIRRGTVTIAQTPLTETITNYYGNRSISDDRGSSSFLVNNKKRSLGPTNPSKVFRQTRFPIFYRGIYSIKFAPEENQFVTAYGAGGIQLWDLSYPDDVVNIKPIPDHGFPIMTLQFIPSSSDNSFFAGGACGTIYLCNNLNPDSFGEFAKENSNEVNAIDVNIGGDTLASGGKDAAIRLYDITTGKIKHIYGRNEENMTEVKMKNFHKLRVFALRFHNEINETLLTGGWDNCVKLWDMRIEDGCVRCIRGPHICGNAIDIKNNIVLTGSWIVENSLQIWDLGTTKLIDTIVPINRPNTIDGEFLYCTQFFKGDDTGNTVIAGGSGVGQVEVIDIANKKVVSSFKVHKSVQAIDTTPKLLVFGGMESTFKMIHMNL